jgi:hypothetical protein
MKLSCSEIQQDSTKSIKTVVRDSIKITADSVSPFKIIPLPDSVSPIKILSLSDSVNTKVISSTKPVNYKLVDTTSVCSRNNVADITFYDSTNFVTRITSIFPNQFPLLFIEKKRKMEIEARALTLKHLNPGQNLPLLPLHNDWIIGVILFTAFLYSLLRTTSKTMLPEVSRFFLFRGINDPSSRDISGLFQWKSTVLNLISFLVFALFTYTAATYFDFIPFVFSGITFWLISFPFIISAVTLRHILCILIGFVSGEKEVFREYLISVYQFYRLSALFLFVLIILMLYTLILPAGIGFISGIIMLGIMYLFRIIRLILIFLNRNISIFYLILYLCALEFLPVVIFVKYFTGLV